MFRPEIFYKLVVILLIHYSSSNFIFCSPLREFKPNTTILDISSLQLNPQSFHLVTDAFSSLHLEMQLEDELSKEEKINGLKRLIPHGKTVQILLSGRTSFLDLSQDENEELPSCIDDIINSSEFIITGYLYKGQFTDYEEFANDFSEEMKHYKSLRSNLKEMKSSLKVGIQVNAEDANHTQSLILNTQLVKISDMISLGLNMTDHESLLYSYAYFAKHLELEQSLSRIIQLVGNVNAACEIILRLYINQNINLKHWDNEDLILYAEHAYRWGAENNVRVIVDFQNNQPGIDLLIQRMSKIERSRPRSEKTARGQLVSRNVDEGMIYLNSGSVQGPKFRNPAVLSKIFNVISKRFRTIQISKSYSKILSELGAVHQERKLNLTIISSLSLNAPNLLNKLLFYLSLIDNAIGNDTVQHIALHWGRRDRDESRIHEKIQIIQHAEDRFSNRNVKFGLKLEMSINSDDFILSNPKFQQVLHTTPIDFVIWDFRPWPYEVVRLFMNDPNKDFLRILLDKGKNREKYQKLFPNLRIIMKVSWESANASASAVFDCKERKSFWDMVFTWAKFNQVEILVRSVFDDNSWPNGESGWWSVLNHDDYTDEEVYVNRMIDEPCPKLFSPGKHIKVEKLSLMTGKYKVLEAQCGNIVCVHNYLHSKNLWRSNLTKTFLDISNFNGNVHDALDERNIEMFFGIHMNISLNETVSPKLSNLLDFKQKSNSTGRMKIGCVVQVPMVKDRFLTMPSSKRAENDKTKLEGNKLELLPNVSILGNVDYAILDLSEIFCEIQIKNATGFGWTMKYVFGRLRGIRIRIMKLFPNINSVILKITPPKDAIDSKELLMFLFYIDELAAAYEFPIILNKTFELADMDMESEDYRGRGSFNITEINNLVISNDPIVTTNHTSKSSGRKSDQNAYLNSSMWLIGAAVIFITFTCFALIWQSRRKSFKSTEYISGTVEMKTTRWLSCKRFINDATLSSSSNIIPLQLNISSDSGENLMINTAYNKEKWEIPKREFKFDSKILGSGNFSIVRKAFIWRFAHPTAVKVPKAGCSKEALKHFIYEIKVLSFIGEHENVLQFLGAFTDELQLGNVYIATEYCQNGSLLSRLRTLSSEAKLNENNKLLILELVRYSVEIARGMEYISGKNVIHGDLSARNILLSGSFTCKLSDFGLSMKIYQYGTKCRNDQRTCLPWRWLAIESLRRYEFSTKSDVWAYGVTLWEIFSLGEIPHPDMTWDGEFMNQLDSGFRLSCPKYAGHCQNSDVYSLMKQCWRSGPKSRPTFDTIINYFQGESSVEYLELRNKPAATNSETVCNK